MEQASDLRLGRGERLVIADTIGKSVGEGNDKRVVHQRERLRGHVGFIAPTLGGDGDGHIKHGKERVKIVADDPHVNAAAVGVEGVRAAERIAVQRAARLQHCIANGLGLEAAQMRAGEDAVVGIDRAHGGGADGAELKGAC